MFLLAWRQGQLDPLRTALTGIALGAVIAVILVLEGFEQGLYYQLERAVVNRKGDLIAAAPGVFNFLVGGSSLPQLSRVGVESVPGVVVAHPITLIPVIYEKDNVRTPIVVFVTDMKGGPTRIIAGRDVTQARDIVVDATLAAIYDIRVGDPLIVSDFEFRVSGITEDDAAMFVPFAFISYDDMIDFFLDSEIAPDISTFPLLSFLLIERDPAADRGRIAAAIEERVASVAIFTPEQMALQDVNFGRVLFGPIMSVLVMVGYVIGLLVAGLILYADVTGRLHSFGVLKALGFPFRRLAQAVIAQALLLLVIGLPIGIVLGQALLFIAVTAPFASLGPGAERFLLSNIILLTVPLGAALSALIARYGLPGLAASAGALLLIALAFAPDLRDPPDHYPAEDTRDLGKFPERDQTLVDRPRDPLADGDAGARDPLQNGTHGSAACDERDDRRRLARGSRDLQDDARQDPGDRVREDHVAYRLPPRRTHVPAGLAELLRHGGQRLARVGAVGPGEALGPVLAPVAVAHHVGAAEVHEVEVRRPLGQVARDGIQHAAGDVFKRRLDGGRRLAPPRLAVLAPRSGNRAVDQLDQDRLGRRAAAVGGEDRADRPGIERGRVHGLGGRGSVVGGRPWLSAAGRRPRAGPRPVSRAPARPGSRSAG